VTDTSISPLGDSAATVRIGDGISEELSELVVRRARAISREGIPGVLDIVPAYGSLTVHYDARTIPYSDVRKRLLAVRTEPDSDFASTRETANHVIEVRYDGEDLDEVARLTRISIDQIIEIHTSVDYRVFVIGFVPGFAYLGPLDRRLVLPRRESPRKRVPAGSVAIAESQTGVYPSETPGGWHLIGRTDVKLFDALRDPPSTFAVGDRVRFTAAK
jgi:KipI family sensor histidine kinase inhibitor